MISLLRNEFIKAYKRKGILITVIIMIAYSLLTNFIYSQIDNLYAMIDEVYYSDISMSDYETNTKDGLELYINDKSISDIHELKEKYDKKYGARGSERAPLSYSVDTFTENL